MTDYDKIKADVAAKLTEIGVAFSVRYCGETVRDEDWKADHYRFTFSSKSSKYESDYYMGLGNRKLPKNLEGKGRDAIRRAAGFWTCSPNDKSSYAERCFKEAVKQLSKPVAPLAADVLYSILRDGQAADMSFIDWCSDYGYDPDSISAFNTYSACCEAGIALRILFSRAQIAELEELTQEM